MEQCEGAADDSFGQEVNPALAAICQRVPRVLRFHFSCLLPAQPYNSLRPATSQSRVVFQMRALAELVVSAHADYSLKAHLQLPARTDGVLQDCDPLTWPQSSHRPVTHRPPHRSIRNTQRHEPSPSHPVSCLRHSSRNTLPPHTGPRHETNCAPADGRWFTWS